MWAWCEAGWLWEIFWSMFGVFGFMYGISFILRTWDFITGACKRDPQYAEFYRNGGDPYFDFLPWPANTDSWSVRIGGRPEPDTAFVPPKDWLCQCTHCGARNQQYVAQFCWHCHAALPGVIVQGNGRTFQCYHCWSEISEMNPGDLDRGVVCPYCGTANYTQQ
jgi:hypothetical protein